MKRGLESPSATTAGGTDPHRAPSLHQERDDGAQARRTGRRLWSGSAGSSDDLAAARRRAFQEEVAPLLSGLYRYALVLCRRGEEAEDLVQVALVNAYAHWDSYSGEGSMMAWLSGILRNVHLETQRSAARRRGLLASALSRTADLLDRFLGEAPASGDPESELLAEETSALALACLQGLREPFRTVVHLCDVEGLPYAEVAALEGIAVGTVKSRHARGRQMLRQAWARGTERRASGEAEGSEA
jgi:RNA polymerase sigma-70 factor (ECF subfamily)